MDYLLKILVVAAVVEISLACNGFKLKTNYVRNCAGSDSLIKVEENSSIKLNKECEIVTTGCAEVTKDFKTAQITYEVVRNGMRLFRGSDDICAQMSKIKEDEKAILTLLSIPDHCPVEKTKLCPPKDKKVKLDKIGKFLPMGVGNPVQIMVNITHDTGVTCMETEIKISK